MKTRTPGCAYDLFDHTLVPGTKYDPNIWLVDIIAHWGPTKDYIMPGTTLSLGASRLHHPTHVDQSGVRGRTICFVQPRTRCYITLLPGTYFEVHRLPTWYYMHSSRLYQRVRRSVGSEHTWYLVVVMNYIVPRIICAAKRRKMLTTCCSNTARYQPTECSDRTSLHRVDT